jgi:hypothetical protein
MRADPDTAHAPDGMCQTPQGEYLMLNRKAKLEKGCTVAVFLAGHFMLVGRIDRRPVPHRRLVICWRDVHGNEGVTRIHGLRDKDTEVWRVTGVLTPVPFADADVRDPD